MHEEFRAVILMFELTAECSIAFTKAKQEGKLHEKPFQKTEKGNMGSLVFNDTYSFPQTR
jgi:hypothetical protein